MFLGERGEFVLRERERSRDLLSTDELDQMLLQQMKVQRRIEVEDLSMSVTCRQFPLRSTASPKHDERPPPRQGRVFPPQW